VITGFDILYLLLFLSYLLLQQMKDILKVTLENIIFVSQDSAYLLCTTHYFSHCAVLLCDPLLILSLL
jgi:hypothetical protein